MSAGAVTWVLFMHVCRWCCVLCAVVFVGSAAATGPRSVSAHCNCCSMQGQVDMRPCVCVIMLASPAGQVFNNIRTRVYAVVHHCCPRSADACVADQPYACILLQRQTLRCMSAVSHTYHTREMLRRPTCLSNLVRVLTGSGSCHAALQRAAHGGAARAACCCLMGVPDCRCDSGTYQHRCHTR